jgi:hypothetical protein
MMGRLEMKRPFALSRERLEYWALAAEIVAAFAVVVSLVFVGRAPWSPYATKPM